MKNRDTFSFRPTKENKQRLELAISLGISVSEILNESLATRLEKKIKERASELRVVLQQIPA